MKLYLPASRTASALSRGPVRRATAFAPGALWREQEALMNRAFRQSSPRFELTNTADKFEIAVDVPGVKASDINVNIEKDGQILTLSGHRETKKEGFQYSSRFSQSFALDGAVDPEKLTANLHNGVLVVSAPKDLKRIEESVKKIPITEHALEQPALESDASEKVPALENATGESGALNEAQSKGEEIVVETVDAEMNEEEAPKAA